MTCCSQHNFKSPTIIMPNDDEGNDQSPREHGTNGGQHQGRHGRNLRRHGNRGVEHQQGWQPKFEGQEPRLQKVTYRTGQGSKPPSNIYEPHVKSAPTLALPIQNILPILQQPWTLLISPTQWSPRHQIQPI